MGTNLLTYSNSASVLTPVQRLPCVAAALRGYVFAAPIAPDLSDRECEILRWTALGKTSNEVGTILGLSTRTVNFHISEILFKLDARNKIQAVVKALMLDLIHLE
jgi:DNA-binding CsgD family transcriptional regulator